MINVEVDKNNNENTVSVLRRFSRRVRGSGILNKVRATRYFKKPASKAMRKKSALKRIVKRTKYEELIRQGKITESVPAYGTGKNYQRKK